MESKPWYQKGLRFECQGSGRCCANHGEYSYVYLTDDEVVGLARLLEVSPEVFLARWCTTEDGWTILRMDEPTCPFLTEERRCSVYSARPKQCSTWPFWSENLERERWEEVVLKLCPGAGRGALHSREEIERIAAENDANQDA